MIPIVDADGAPRPTHEIVEDFVNQFFNANQGLPITIFVNRLALDLCELVAAVRGEEIPDGRFTLDDQYDPDEDDL
jgi:hypothetical protein